MRNTGRSRTPAPAKRGNGTRQTEIAPHADGGELARLVERIDRLVARVEGILPAPAAAPDWAASIAFRWRKRSGSGRLEPVAHPHRIALSDLQNVDRQKALVERNTRQFVTGRPANNVLLTGSRGTGKSSLVKALLNRFHRQGLRLIEVDKQDLVDLPDLVDLVAGRPERFLIFCDDLSFEASEAGYKALKVVLDGSIAATSENVLIYATSNRRHLMPEYMQENLEYKHVGEEIHPGETSEEKISLSERFGLWVSFYPFDQDDYLGIVAHWLASMGCGPREIETATEEALQWALSRGSRSGRVAWQFARDYAGRHDAGDARPARRAR
jgi:predicted AAA+ superfamily ATPase